MTVYQWLCLFGIPTLFVTAFLTVFRCVFQQIKGVRLGVKALLRAQMISDYNKWHERGYAPIYAKQNFENLWEQYHSLKGPNGVMDDLHAKFVSMPTENKEEK